MRAEFDKRTKRAILVRSGGVCERHLWRPRERCTRPACEFDHVTPCELGGAADLSNGAHLCTTCHKEKTHSNDRPRIGKAKRQADAGHGITGKGHRPIQNPPARQRDVPNRLPLPPRQGLYR